MTDTTATFGVFCPGMLDVLSIGKGDMKLVIDGEHPEDVDRARQLISEMLRAGYAIFVDTDDGPTRVHQFNPNRMTYSIHEAPALFSARVAPALSAGEPDADGIIDADVIDDDADEVVAAPLPKVPRGQRKPARKRSREVPVAGSRATAVGRTAGG